MSKIKKSESGISIIELLVVVVITAIVITSAIYQFGDSKTQFAREKVALEFKTGLERARFDSIKRRATVAADMARVVINSKTSFTVRTDQNMDGILSANEKRDVDFGSTSTTEITNAGLNYPVTISFDNRGYINAVDNTGAQVSPIFKVCSKNCSTETTANTTVITLSSTGTVINAVGGYVAPTLQNPNVNNVPANTKINSLVKVNSNSY